MKLGTSGTSSTTDTPEVKAVVPPTPGGIFQQFAEIDASVKAGFISEDEASCMRKRIISGTNGQTVTNVVDEEKTALADHFKEVEMRNFQPWRRDVQKFEQIVAEWKTISLEELQDTFLAKAKAGQMSTTETMLAIYLLYGGPDQPQFLRCMLVNTSGAHRMFMHNVYVATTRERSFMQLHGEEIVRMSVPLFPAGREFNVLNNQVLSAEVTGGGPQDRRSGLFRETEEGDPMGGGISLPVQGPGQDGNYYVDMTQVQEAMFHLEKQQEIVSGLVAGIQKSQAQSRGGQKGGYWKNKKNQYNQQNATPPAYGQQNYPHHYSQQSNQYQARGNPLGAGESPETPATTAKRN